MPFEEEKKYQFLEDLENYKILDLSPVGRYVKYLEELSVESEFYKSIKESIKVAGGLPASTAIWFPMNHDKFYFNVPKHRLWGAVFILGIEEPHDKKMDRYLNQ